MGLRAAFAALLPRVRQTVCATYQDNLVSLAIFGSVARGTPGPESDLDLLIVCRHLPRGRGKRMADFTQVEGALAPDLAQLAATGIQTTLSPVIKTAAEAQMGSHLFLDMVHDVIVLHDPDGFLMQLLAETRAALQQQGARRVQQGSRWYWQLHADPAAKGDNGQWPTAR